MNLEALPLYQKILILLFIFGVALVIAIQVSFRRKKRYNNKIKSAGETYNNYPAFAFEPPMHPRINSLHNVLRDINKDLKNSPFDCLPSIKLRLEYCLKEVEQLTSIEKTE